ncbi:MAG: SUF system Fe-S cluster assembly regulator [Rhodospirillaceae bacterium]|nr:SUF system Fe-S cluster assembly regulator [Rhodospirillaceae bacterium]|tara:strand:+ start:6473 stop:6925 length:453 start_codon:yes stop_codon:yes gene_type:complete
MIRLSRMADYGVVVMTYMAWRHHENHSAHQVAEGTGLSEATVAKLLKMFARENLLGSHRGVHGGYQLNRKPEEITVAQIVEAVEGPIALTLCVDNHPGSCDVQSLCPMRGGWNQINTALRDAFEGVSLAAMALPKPTDFNLTADAQRAEL